MNNPSSTHRPIRSAGARRLRQLGLALSIGLFSALPVLAQVSVEFNIQGEGIGIQLRSYPSLVRVPGYPVYYAPQERANYFFYDGLYWVYQGDVWYQSRWYNGPWAQVDRDLVPLFLLRVPVRYYRQPPVYFRSWLADAPPRWGEYWGNDWAQRRPGWDRWDHRNVPRAAPLPVYQRPYSGDRYPRQPERQDAIRAEHERGQPNDNVTRPMPRPPTRPDAQRLAPLPVPAPSPPRPARASPPAPTPHPPPQVQPRPAPAQLHPPAVRPDKGDKGDKSEKKVDKSDKGGDRKNSERDPDKR